MTTVQAFTDEVRTIILKRQRGRCVLDGLIATTGHFHHRRPRRMGGGRDVRVGFPANGVLLHTKCHDWVEKHRFAAICKGLILYAGEDPEKIPILTWEGWRLLVGDESLPCEPPDEYLSPRKLIDGTGPGSTDVSGLRAQRSEPSP